MTSKQYKPGLYIIVYHEVSFEISESLQGIGWYHSPDVFERHVKYYEQHFELISLSAGIEQLTNGSEFDRPHLTFWFDDGFTGVREHAAPILAERNITGGISICSRFTLRQEMYWHCILSSLHRNNLLPRLRSQLKNKFNYNPAMSVKFWVHNNFSAEILQVITELYQENTTNHYQTASFEIFDTLAGLQSLDQAGWLITNHTAAHHPVHADAGDDNVTQQFTECQQFLQDHKFRRNQFLVIPFSCKYPIITDPKFYHNIGCNGTVVDVGNRINTVEEYRRNKVIYRYNPEWKFALKHPL